MKPEMDRSAQARYRNTMRLLAALLVLTAFVTNGAAAQFRAEANLASAVATNEAAVISADVRAHGTSVKVCMRALLTGMPQDEPAPGSPCGPDFKLAVEYTGPAFPAMPPDLGAARDTAMRPADRGPPFRPPIA